MRKILRILTILVIAISVVNCTGVQVFSKSARPGETVAFALGWNQDLTSSDITMSITDSASTTVPITSRAAVNLYPDPISNLLVDAKTNPESGPDTSKGFFWSFQLEDSVTSGDSDFSQKLIVADIPAGLSSGPATINISSATLSTSIDIEILADSSGTASTDEFPIQETPFPELGVSFGDKLRLAERAPHNVISFSGSQIPHAIQLEIAHMPDKDNGGVGRPFVATGRSDIKNITWSDDGSNMRVIILPARTSETIPSFANFKFYIAGGLTGLLISNVSAYDSNGNIVNGVTAQIN